MKLIIAGGRDFSQCDMVASAVAHAANRMGKFVGDISEIVSGGASGADACGEEYAKAAGIPLKVFPADWDKHGRAAGPIRNQQMAEYADGLLCFWDGKSRGTANMLECMKKLGKPSLTIYY